jgi:hypothetical protein
LRERSWYRGIGVKVRGACDVAMAGARHTTNPVTGQSTRLLVHTPCVSLIRPGTWTTLLDVVERAKAWLLETPSFERLSLTHLPSTTYNLGSIASQGNPGQRLNLRLGLGDDEQPGISVRV